MIETLDQEVYRADVLIVTAIRLEYDAVLRVDAGAVPGSTWDESSWPSGLPIAFRPFLRSSGRTLRVAVAQAADMGPTAVTNTLLPLVELLRPRCIAMCGVCAGRRGKTNLGDVVAGDRLFFHDTGKRLPHEVQQDLTTYNTRDAWKVALQGMDVVARFGDADWFKARPVTAEWREYRALKALGDGAKDPWNEADPSLDERGWQELVEELKRKKLLRKTGRELTVKGRRLVERVVFEHKGAMPDLSPAGAYLPFRLHVAPIGSGAQVIEDERIFAFISASMRKTLAIEMEAAAVGEVAHRQSQHRLDAIVMKGVMDFANHGRDDHFKEFAARASAECLLAFLREHVLAEAVAGYDDLLSPGTSPRLGGEASPSFLLNARHGVVPWYDLGRSELLARLDAWADDEERDVGVCLLHAEGGVGKTRLAIEWVARRRERQDAAGFLITRPDSRWFERLCALGAPVMVVVDYAETRADLDSLLERVAAYAAVPGPRRRIRMLLLARGDGDWWAQLPRRSDGIRAVVDGATRIRLMPLAVTPAERADVFNVALQAFANERGRTANKEPPIDLEDARFERVLYIHMAALAAVEGVPVDSVSLMDVILDHEERFWSHEQAARFSWELDTALARQLVAAATLRGGFETVDHVRATCARIAKRQLTREDEALIALLRAVYGRPSGQQYLPALEPDLLGEAIVVRVAAPPIGAGTPGGDSWIDGVFAPGEDEDAIIVGFTVLARASTTAASAVRPWLTSLLRTDLRNRAALALRAEKSVARQKAFSPLGDLLAAALNERGDASIAAALDAEGIPFPSVSLRQVAVWRSRVLLAMTPAETDLSATPSRVERLARLAEDLFAAGQAPEALENILKAEELVRELCGSGQGGFIAVLAEVLRTRSGILRGLGRDQEALEAAQQAVHLYRSLAAQRPDEFLPRLAASVDELGNRLRAVGQHAAALSVTSEVVDTFRFLADRDPHTYRRHLALSLNNRANKLDELGRLDDALAAISEASELAHALYRLAPDMYQELLADTSYNAGNIWSKFGDNAKSLALMSEAEELYRQLADHNPDKFLPDLAAALNNCGESLHRLRRHEDALASTRKAVAIRRSLATENPVAFGFLYARSLTNLVGQLVRGNHREEAEAVAREAVGYIRQLVTEGNHDTRLRNLGQFLDRIGDNLCQVGRTEEGLAAKRYGASIAASLATRQSET